MRFIRFCSSAFVFSLFTIALQAQSYKTAAGVRIDNGVQITIQQYLLNNWTAEGIIHTSVASDNLGLTLLAEKHQKIIFRGTNLYYGAGGHYYWNNQASRSDTQVNNNVYGLSFIGGAELTLGRINLAIDWKPELHLSESAKPFDWNGASVSVRYIFAKRERNKVKDWKVWDTFGGKKNTNKKRK